ncbi:MAG: endonuclease V [Methanomassiliicoccales archaeon]|nr:endonuclease V [Methanomassiliicoccales archaeon]
MKCRDVDLVSLILETVRQVPAGRVTTYGDVARALGDVRAARAVAEVLRQYDAEDVPRHRVVNVDGGIEAATARQLLDEGIAIKDGRVLHLERLRLLDLMAEPVLAELQKEQEALRSRIIQTDDFPVSGNVTGLDVSYSKDRAFVASVRMSIEGLDVLEVRHAVAKVRFPYIPSYLGYRELPMIAKVFEPTADKLLLVDGQGVLHPRGFGIACQVGVCLDVATIGAAKSKLVGTMDGSGARSNVLIDGEIRGRRLKPDHRKGIFVSVGHKVSLDTACGICEGLMIKGVPEPLRLAHMLATRMRRETSS